MQVADPGEQVVSSGAMGVGGRYPDRAIAGLPLPAVNFGPPVSSAGMAAYVRVMFTIEHEFDSTVITLVDESGPHFREDVIINAFEDCVTVEQHEPTTDRVNRVTFSMSQLRDLAVALDLPEGAYKLLPEDE